MIKPCPCGSGKAFAECCKPVIDGAAAASPEVLMRSRYSAYVEGEWEYLRQSWHPDSRPSRVRPIDTEWLGLSILRAEGDIVEFSAGFREGDKIKALHETSRFGMSEGHWRYIDGTVEIRTLGRNDPCPCGSGKKCKQCCGRSPRS